jgi:hypothetical protein
MDELKGSLAVKRILPTSRLSPTEYCGCINKLCKASGIKCNEGGWILLFLLSSLPKMKESELALIRWAIGGVAERVKRAYKQDEALKEATA